METKLTDPEEVTEREIESKLDKLFVEEETTFWDKLFNWFTQ